MFVFIGVGFRNGSSFLSRIHLFSVVHGNLFVFFVLKRAVLDQGRIQRHRFPIMASPAAEAAAEAPAPLEVLYCEGTRRFT